MKKRQNRNATASLFITTVAMGLICLAYARPVFADDAPRDVLMDALSDELQRSMDQLYVEGLAKPYFIHYEIEERYTVTLSSAYHGLLRSDDNRSRSFRSRVRVGTPTLDNTNVGGAFGGRASLPIDDDYTAIRHEIWQATDGDYKRAVETLARKEAILKEKTIEDRPDDFSPAEPAKDLQPKPDFKFDQKEWENRIQEVAARFKNYPQIQDSRVDLFTGVGTSWIANSEGTRLRHGDTGAILQISAELQSTEGMRLSDDRSYMAATVDKFPPMADLLKDVDAISERLLKLKDAPIPEHYVGPVLFEPKAAAKVFESLMLQGLCARPTPLGAGGTDQGFEKKIGTRILPRSFSVYDDPTAKEYEGKYLAGNFTYDDEGVKTSRVNLVEKGVLKTMLSGRAPTKKIKQTTGHARGGGFGEPVSMIGNLFINDENGVTAEELKQELIDAARDEGLEFAMRIESMDSGGGGDLGNPVFAYKVYVADGREELIRGMQFMPVDIRSLKRILAASKERQIYNAASIMAYSIVTPAVVFEELELSKIEEEFDKLPILKSPALRTAKGPDTEVKSTK